MTRARKAPGIETGMDARASILAAWATNNRVMTFLVERLPPALWSEAVPGAPRRTIRQIAAHVHNVRCGWIRTLGRVSGIPTPARVDPFRVSPRQLAVALRRSGRGIDALLRLAFDRGGRIPPPPTYVWRNLPLDVGHILAYFVAHEGHHRGQLVLLARQLGHRLPESATDGIWQWTRLSKEAGR